MKQKYLPAVGRRVTIKAYCGAYGAAALYQKHALIAHIPGVTKADFMRRCAIYHLSLSLRTTT